MDLVAEMVLAQLAAGHPGEVAAERVCPPFRRRLTRWPVVGRLGAARNADRLLNRFGDYPRALRRVARTASRVAALSQVTAAALRNPERIRPAIARNQAGRGSRSGSSRQPKVSRSWQVTTARPGGSTWTSWL